MSVVAIDALASKPCISIEGFAFFPSAFETGFSLSGYGSAASPVIGSVGLLKYLSHLSRIG